ncbi:MAG TPA: hypothetical protein VIN65_04490 [Candidatus Dormibacteraeota bacterium]
MAEQLDLEGFIEAVSKGALRAVEARQAEPDPHPWQPWHIIIGVIYRPELGGETEGATRAFSAPRSTSG